MTTETTDKLLGVGLYTVPEAARLIRIAAIRIRRWVAGYSYSSTGGEIRSSEPICVRQLPDVSGELGMGFLDLVEMRMVDALLRRRLTWKMIRRAHAHACALFQTTHPFATRKFKTDGRAIFTDLQDESGGKALLDVAASQYEFRKLVNPYLTDIDFNQADLAVRWWPVSGRRKVVLDPARSFGQPIVTKEGVPTSVLANAARVEKSERVVAKWYKVSVASVRAAVAFENQLAA